MTIYAYPCKRGGQIPVGYHQFQWSNGHVICQFCGYEALNVTTRPTSGDHFQQGEATR